MEHLKWFATLFFGDPKTRVPKAIIYTALAILGAPWWQPIFLALVKRFVDVDIAAIESGDLIAYRTGVGLLAIGLILFIWIKSTNPNLSTRNAADLESVKELFRCVNTNDLDNFFDDGRSNNIRFNLVQYWEGFSAKYTSATTYFHDRKLGRKFQMFHRHWMAAMDVSRDAIPLPDGRGFKLKVNPNEPELSQRLIDRFQMNLQNTEQSFRDLLQYVKRKYPEFDQTETSKIAFERMLEYLA